MVKRLKEIIVIFGNFDSRLIFFIVKGFEVEGIELNYEVK